MKISEMFIHEKYDQLYDQFVMTDITTYAFLKGKGVLDEYADYFVKVTKKMVPTLLGSAFKLVKMLTPGRAFKQLIKSQVAKTQVGEPLSNIELVSLSDREAVLRIKNSVSLKKYRDLVKKSDLDLDVMEMMELGIKINTEVSKEFGIDLTYKIEEDGFTLIAKLL